MEKESLFHLVRDTVATYAERPCYWVKPDNKNFQAVTYFNWRQDMKRFQAYLLHRIQVAHGQRIGLICDNRYEWNLLSLGICGIGAVDVPRGCDATDQDVLYILNHAEASVAIVENEKMLRRMIKLLPELPGVKHLISIDPQEKYKKLDDLDEIPPTVELHFFIDMLIQGDDILKQNGESLLKKRGEAIKPNDLATIIYTSGTTGTPKGVMLDHRAFCWVVNQMQSHLPMTEQDRAVVFLPPWHIAERALEVTLMACGASMANSGIVSLGVDLTTIKPTIFLSVPRVWEQLYKRVFDNVRKQDEKKQRIFRFAENVAATYTDIMDTLSDRFAESEESKTDDKLLRRAIAAGMFLPYFILNIAAQVILKKVKNIFGGKMRFAVSGAGALPEHVALFFRSVGIPILDAYGMTETTAVGAIGELPWPKRGAVGPVIPGGQIQLRNEQGMPVTRPGEKGVAWHKGPHVMKGYYNNEEKTREVLNDGWLNSGDIFVWTTTGELKFAGRAKDTVVLAGGENVEPGPIELQLAANEFIHQVMVVGQDKKTLGALIHPNIERATAALKEQGIEVPENTGDWNHDKKIHKFFQDIIKTTISAQTGFKAFEKVTHFYIIPKEFEKGKEMTETMKVKRNVVLDIYEKEIHEMYGEH